MNRKRGWAALDSRLGSGSDLMWVTTNIWIFPTLLYLNYWVESQSLSWKCDTNLIVVLRTHTMTLSYLSNTVRMKKEHGEKIPPPLKTLPPNSTSHLLQTIFYKGAKKTVYHLFYPYSNAVSQMVEWSVLC